MERDGQEFFFSTSCSYTASSQIPQVSECLSELGRSDSFVDLVAFVVDDERGSRSGLFLSVDEAEGA